MVRFLSSFYIYIFLVRIHKLYQFLNLLRELYRRQVAPAANNLPDNFWKKLFRSHLWLCFGWLCVGSSKRSGKDCIFRIDQRVHPYVRLATTSTYEKPDCGLFKDSLRIYVITCASSVGNVSLKSSTIWLWFPMVCVSPNSPAMPTTVEVVR